MRHAARRRKVSDWLFYVVIGVFVVAVVGVVAVRDADAGRSQGLPLKWLGFAAVTGIVFGYAIRAGRRSWRTRRFWFLIAVFFGAHLAVGVFVLARVDRVALSFYALLTGVEYAGLTAYLGLFLHDD